MADRYWVGGSGNWDATSTTNWAATSGGTAGASAPTSADNVIFDANSNTGTDPFTVTVTGTSGSPSLCNDFTAGSLDGTLTFTMGATAQLDCYGSMTLPASNFTWSGTSGSKLVFKATTTGKTITTNGVLIAGTEVSFNDVGGGWTLGSAFQNSIAGILLSAGTLDTGNYNITGLTLQTSTSSVKTLTLGSSTITLSAAGSFQHNGSNLTFNANTSTIICSNVSPTFNGGGLTFYNVEFSGGAGTKTINGANTFSGQFLVSNTATSTIAFGASQTFTGGALIQSTNPTVSGDGFTYTGTFEFASAAHGTKIFGTNQTFQNLKITCPAVDGITTSQLNGAGFTVSGTLTTTDGGSTSRRVQFVGLNGIQRTLTVATNSLINTDFRDIIAAGTASWVFGLGYGNLGNNTGITFDNSTLYWIGGTGNWSDGTKWSTSSGGSAANAIPLYQNSVIFDAGSNTGTNPFTVTVDGTSSVASVCNDFSTGGAGGALDGAMTLSMGATAVLDCYGSLTLPATNFTWTGTNGAQLRFVATTTGKTITTNGVTLATMGVLFNGVGGEWTLGSAITTTTNGFQVNAGSFVTANYNITSATIIVSNNTLVKSVSLGSSTITLSGPNPITINNFTNLTWNSGTSSIVCSNSNSTFTGLGQTFYNVSFTSAASGTTTISGANTFNNLTQTSRSATGIRAFVISANQTVSGTLTLGVANTAIRRIQVASDGVGTQRTITLNGTLATLADVDFRDIATAGTAGTWTGTRLGNAQNNSGITFDAPKTVYWNLAGTANWSATGWATTNNGTPAANNFPLAQDTATFTEAGAAGTITIDQNWYIGNIQMADGVSNRTTAFTIANSGTFRCFGNITLFSNLVWTTGTLLSFQHYSGTKTFTSAGVSIPSVITIQTATGTVQLLDNLTCTNTVTLTQGTLDLNDFDLTCNIFSSSNSNTRSIDFGTGEINLTGNNATIWSMGTATNFTYAGTPTINCTYSGSTGTRTINVGGTTAPDDDTVALSFYISSGTDIFSIGGSGLARYRTIDFTGFSGTLGTASLTRGIYGNLTFSSGMTIDAATGAFAFRATSGTQQITTNGKTLDLPLTMNGSGGTVQLQDNLTMGSTRTFTLTAGTLDLSSGNRTLSCGLFSSSNSNTRAITFGTGNITITGNDTTIWGLATLTGFSYTGTPTVNCTYSGSTGIRIVSNGGTAGATESNTVNFNITSGTDTFAFSASSFYKNINFTGFAGTLTNAVRTIYGNLIISSGMTLTAGTSATTFAATSGTQELTTNGKTLDFPITINGVGGTVELQDALTMGSTRTLTLTNGTFTTSNYNVTTGRMLFNAGTRVLNMGSSTFTINGYSGTNLFWYIVDGTNLTINAGTSTINLNKAAVVGEFQAFYSNGFTYHNLNITNSADAVIYGGDNTFNNISNTYSPVSILFGAGTTQTVNNFTVSGTPSNLVTLESDVPGSVWYLTKTSGTVTVTYCDISDSDANGGATFNCINGVNSGNNTGWNFSSSQFSSGNFLAFF